MKLTVRLLIFNVLLAVFPIGAVFFLSTYENQLLESQERSMVQQGRMLASAIASASNPLKLQKQAESIFTKLKGRNDARLRVVAFDGIILADSSLLRENENSIATDKQEPLPAVNPQNNIVYRFSVWLPRLTRQLFNLLMSPKISSNTVNADDNEEYLKGPEILAAFNGKYAAFTRISSGQKSVTLYSAIPVLRNGEVNEVVLVSKSTLSILSDLYSLRLNFVYIFLFSLLGAVILSILLARTVTVPIGKLKKQSEQILDSRGKLHSPFKALSGPDEVAQLSRALNHLSSRLQTRTEHLEKFTADLVHELKNPIAGILSASELTAQSVLQSNTASESAKDIRHFMEMIDREGHRIQNLLDDMQELIKIDVGMERGQVETINPSQFITSYIRGMPGRPNGVTIKLIDKLPHEVFILMNPERLLQALSNLLDNAVSFSKPGQSIEVIMDSQKDELLQIQVADRGPGIPEKISAKVFERWYTDRSEQKEGKNIKHTGLGLAIVKGIAEASGGKVTLTSRENGGTVFTLCLPLSRQKNITKYEQKETEQS